jgi:hypothetical protein
MIVSEFFHLRIYRLALLGNRKKFGETAETRKTSAGKIERAYRRPNFCRTGNL